MNNYGDWAAAQHADECARLQQIIEALERAEQAGTPHEMVELLARECGAGEIYRTQSERS